MGDEMSEQERQAKLRQLIARQRARNAARKATWDALPWHEKRRRRLIAWGWKWRLRVRDAWWVLTGRAEIE